MERSALFFKSPVKIFPVIVDYTKIWQQMLKEAGFNGNNVNPIINEANFPLSEVKGKAQTNVVILTPQLDINQFIFSHEIKKNRALDGFQPIGMEHLFSFCARYGSKYLGRVVNIDTVSQYKGTSHVVTLRSTKSEFELSVLDHSKPFGCHCSFFGLCPN